MIAWKTVSTVVPQLQIFDKALLEVSKGLLRGHEDEAIDKAERTLGQGTGDKIYAQGKNMSVILTLRRWRGETLETALYETQHGGHTC
jgi:hypothetical protein